MRRRLLATGSGSQPLNTSEVASIAGGVVDFAEQADTVADVHVEAAASSLNCVDVADATSPVVATDAAVSGAAREVDSLEQVDVTLAEIAMRNRGRPFAKNVHKMSQESLLSVAAEGTDFRGLFNLFVIVLVAANVRLMVENMLKYGLLIELPGSVFDFYRNWPCGVCYLEMISLVVGIWAIERHGAKLQWTDKRLDWLRGIALLLILLVPCWTVRISSSTPGNSVLLLLFAMSWCMKMVSFVHICFDIRRAIARGVLHELCCDDAESQRIIDVKGYPQCLRLTDMFLYLVYPTLCFQLHYPRLPRVRKRRLARHVVALVGSIILGYILIEQYIKPLLMNTRKYVRMEVAGPDGIPVLKVSPLGLLERLLKLSLPNLYLWLIIFYALFHSWLNVLAEISRFGDRRFYHDWWNAASFGEYWKRWNMPVHHWCLRHVYFPLIRRGWHKLSAGFIVFLISGLMHELLVVVPLRMNRPTILVSLAFVGQLPLTIMTANQFLEKRHRSVGNGLFWLAFCFSGQPLAILIYFLLAADPELETMGSIFSLR
eukprot:TRINITY_DN74185_c0_g1_i1.p1 TRINITY_DN74185_c0_g1~~TRINITY_DN74185_c0_g1_i1.p1  ORF type:complete len:544 (-),score=72.11 TRINITY_DN74185_c0_g1_i1:153-1784(-)